LARVLPWIGSLTVVATVLATVAYIVSLAGIQTLIQNAAKLVPELLDLTLVRIGLLILALREFLVSQKLMLDSE